MPIACSDWPHRQPLSETDVCHRGHYWPAALALVIEAEQMTASDYVRKYSKLPLASEGASTDAIQQAAPLRAFVRLGLLFLCLRLH